MHVYQGEGIILTGCSSQSTETNYDESMEKETHRQEARLQIRVSRNASEVGLETVLQLGINSGARVPGKFPPQEEIAWVFLLPLWDVSLDTGFEYHGSYHCL